MKKITAFILTIIVFTSCKTNTLSLTVTEPAPVTIPSYMKKIGVINRSAPTAKTKDINKLDEILSGEGPELDKEGAKESIAGVTDELKNNSRFTEVKALNLDLKTTAMGVFPAPLDWPTVDKICKENGVDALFALELYDTDTKVDYAAVPTTIKTPLGDVPATEHHATMVTMVKTGWRIYDPKNRYVLDEFPLNESITFKGKGINPIIAASSLIGRKDAVKEVSNRTGRIYAERILPQSLRVSREYYVKGNTNFAIATRRARTGKWNDAGELWKKETTNADAKLAARASYNMAIINEINGDLEAALDWAQKGYEIGGKRMALHYVNILKRRMASNARLQHQEEQAK